MTTEPPEISRLDAAGVSAILERVAGAELAARGAVNIISMGAIKAKLGERWERGRSAVWTFVEKRFAEHLSSHDLAHRINDTDFLIAHTSDEGAAAQASCIRILEEVLTHFLGEAEPAYLRLRTVTSVGEHEIGCREIDHRSIRRAATERPRPQAPAASRLVDGVDPELERLRNPVSFVTASGRRLKVEFTRELVISLRHSATAAVRIEPRVIEERSGRVIPVRAFAKLPDDEIALIDKASIDYAALFLKRAGAPVLLPASYRTLMTSKGRGLLIAAAGEAAGLVRSNLLVELVDVDRGTPPGRLTEVCALLASLVRGVFVRLQPGRDALAPLQGSRLAGLVLDGADLGTDASKIANLMLDFGRLARGRAPVVAALGMPSESYFQIAEVAGLTHASVRAGAAAAAAA